MAISLDNPNDYSFLAVQIDFAALNL